MKRVINLERLIESYFLRLAQYPLFYLPCGVLRTDRKGN
ncbi:hypothetical protein H1P_4860005 [Hyella patelloides LEGE 07179]|uniref:Uncharacterized protein n=1 Tax=Hyella patelloides LEGE 07179 TaxID=945734 RepID=A0A563VZ59_9CYAN|nr:hypothetical protein H1P_4860005 [Hyella patelloides LEGE 07179]